MAGRRKGAARSALVPRKRRPSAKGGAPRRKGSASPSRGGRSAQYRRRRSLGARRRRNHRTSRIGLALAVAAAVVVLLCFFAVQAADQQVDGLTASESEVASYWREKGLDNLHIAAIMGNIKQESDFNPSESSNGVAVGLCQWGLDVDGSEGNALMTWADDTGRDWTDVGVQMDWLWAEMTHKGPAGSYATKMRDDHGSLEGFLALSSLEGDENTSAAAYFERWIEGAGRPMNDRRNAYAQHYLELLNARDAQATTSGDS